MKKTSTNLSLALILTIASCSFALSQASYFTLDPCLSPDGETIVFSYEGDLWQVRADGGTALRLTAMEGEETRPNISPDGAWLAFSGTQYGNKDIYVMPLSGGEIRQLTFHEAFDDVDSWSWDSGSIYFTSNRYNRYSGYAIPAKGGTPVRLFGHYFNTVHNLAEHPVSGEIFFNESWESKTFAHRKRYKGDFNPDIKSYNRESGTFTIHTSYRGKDFAPTIDSNGKLYFASDESNGEYNLYTIANGQKERLTNFGTSIYWPKVSADGSKVVFRKDYQVFVYDTETGESSRPAIHLFQNQTLAKDRDYPVQGKISNFDVAPDNKKMAFTSRGRLFVSDIKGKFVRELETDPKEASGEVRWLKDGKTLLYAQTAGGYYNWHTIRADGSSDPERITEDTQNNRQLSFNSDRSKAVYLSGRNELRMMDLESMESRTIAEDELWAMYNPVPRFSPDDRYIAYTVRRHFEQDIFLYDTKADTSINLTRTRVSETQPFWSPDGKYLYFSTDRLNPGYPYGTQNAGIYRLMLDRFDEPFRSEKLDELFAEEEKQEMKDKKDEKDEKDEKKKKMDEENNDEKDTVVVKIEPVDAMDRLERISPSFGQQQMPWVIEKDDKMIVLYLSNHDEGKNRLWKTVIQPFESNKTELVSEKSVNGHSICEAKDKLYLLTGGDIYKLDAYGDELEKVEISHSFRKNLSDEFGQMFYEAWAGFEENFYSEDFHGQDWEALRDRYAAYLPRVRTRSQLRAILNDMLGELNTSHFGFYSSGEEEETYHGTRSVCPGIIFDNEEPYTVQGIVDDGPSDKVGIDIRPGDRMLRVDGQAVDPLANRESYFTRPSIDKEIALRLLRDGDTIKANIHPVSYGTVKGLMYDEWEEANEAYVDQMSNARIGYVHMKNMGRGEYNRFAEYMVGEGAYRDALILDLRYNTGGNVHDDVLQFLSQRAYLRWKYREGKLTTQSNIAPAEKPIVLLINEPSLSDAEMTAAGFKELGLGTIIGTETYRWIIFTSGKRLVDGSFYRLPSWGCYTLDGRNLEKEGVSPDIRVEKDFADRLEGRHPQLDAAMEWIKGRIKD